ncbi:MAG: hypothetical protein HYS27_04880 [Deltaproteobacteria bacterium]|nr:hypothetical protein [Deltaproteobacteria bacterium]
MAYECLNPRCPYYAGNNVRLENDQVYVDANHRVHCRRCQSFVRAAPAKPGAEKAVVGAAGGALLGWAVGGPPGALIGGVLGLLLGDNADKGNT